ncbi:MAG TPA: methylenetetrahydrofolate--tRNA-(uracil(54)-C(5))-methyltransferase (FADH(2)-oxidizing) TrmFO [Vicinamibacterales bacterium]|nr:methylenetetrahydrofolate--tRNA-(uracil(54)-C(5))-methyltransferase (FADH(2)-oxidizing) TrmFO [Vicinamibacterales bacterium]HPK71062.1 methylenetetrahydrofolate--tRNA-(uracil(54)-C(5))-methyltransferase (FADH(2)-oxidizing) TrmFO [Vicinamibacterales bacterium]HPW19868.1 methylenetetrahydrofolate--tRNA-(uracil(54)-C(5))-methyltransferase (FADH(2)-oxidizing) TrmFO [Vicinamibacterales bacterium]
MPAIRVIGGGLAGCEAAWQAASRGVSVTLHEMRPVRMTEVHRTGDLAELVCSNSLRADKLDNAAGLLKAEMRRLGSLVMRAADATRVPAGAALAVDRRAFAAYVTAAIDAHPLITVVRGEVTEIPAPAEAGGPVIVATGPLTSGRFAASLAAAVGEDCLYFYDAISPIVSADSIDRRVAFRASRWDRSLGPEGAEAGGDYLNCPMNAEEYRAFHAALAGAEGATLRDLDRAQFFEGCLPIEVLARRGADALRFGPMKPVGLADPRTGRRPYAVVQLRQDSIAGDHYSLVGFQTQLKRSEQERVFRMIPGLAGAEFVRFGMVHRNTYINAPRALRDTWQSRTRSDLFIAGQVSGVEGYVESAASGLLAGLNAGGAAAGGAAPTAAPPTTAIGALARYVSHASALAYQPSNITFGIIEPLESPPRHAHERRHALAARALADLDRWMIAAGLATQAAGGSPEASRSGPGSSR